MTDPTNTLPTPYQSGMLKPCPFCGVIPKIERKDSGILRYRVYCRDSNEQNWYDHIEYGQVFYRTNPESLTRAWNRYVDKHLKRIERNEQSRTKMQWREME